MGQYYPFFKAYDVRAKVPDELDAGLARRGEALRAGACKAAADGGGVAGARERAAGVGVTLGVDGREDGHERRGACAVGRADAEGDSAQSRNTNLALMTPRS